MWTSVLFPHFNVDYADVLLGPYIDPKMNANKSSKSVQTSCQRSTEKRLKPPCSILCVTPRLPRLKKRVK